MAKYKVGDKVKVGGHTATIVKILGTSASGEQMYGVKQDDNGWAYESLEGKMKAAANAKFKVGQKVARVSDGKVGVIQEAYADGTYAVHVDGEANPNKMPENRIRAVNADVCNLAPSVIKARDKVKAMSDSDAKKRLTELVAKYKSGGSMPSALGAELDYLCERFGKNLDELARNSTAAIKSTNPIVANALKAKNAVATNASPVKPGERCKWRNGPFEWKGVLVSGKPGNYIVKDDDGRQHVWHGNVYHLDEKYQTISTPFGTIYNSKNATNTAEKARAFYDAASKNVAAALRELQKANDNLNRAASEDDSSVSKSVGLQYAKRTKEIYEELAKITSGLNK